MTITYKEDFITEKEEREILTYIYLNIAWTKLLNRSSVQLKTIPEIFLKIFSKISDDIENVTVGINQYKKGKFIEQHIDRPICKNIYVVSILNKGTISFSDGVNLDLSRRSLYILENEHTIEYTHGVLPHTEDIPRISIIYRRH